MSYFAADWLKTWLRKTGSFWKKLKTEVQPLKNRQPVWIGEAESVNEILELWNIHFGQVINSEAPDNVDRERLLFEETLKGCMDAMKKPWWFVEIHPLEVERACHRLKLHKADGPDMVESEHVNYGGLTVAIHLSVALTSFLRHLFVPHEFIKSYIVPIT